MNRSVMENTRYIDVYQLMYEDRYGVDGRGKRESC